jgi:hypothetical protein
VAGPPREEKKPRVADVPWYLNVANMHQGCRGSMIALVIGHSVAESQARNRFDAFPARRSTPRALAQIPIKNPDRLVTIKARSPAVLVPSFTATTTKGGLVRESERLHKDEKRSQGLVRFS